MSQKLICSSWCKTPNSPILCRAVQGTGVMPKQFNFFFCNKNRWTPIHRPTVLVLKIDRSRPVPWTAMKLWVSVWSCFSLTFQTVKFRKTGYIFQLCETFARSWLIVVQKTKNKWVRRTPINVHQTVGDWVGKQSKLRIQHHVNMFLCSVHKLTKCIKPCTLAYVIIRIRYRNVMLLLHSRDLANFYRKFGEISVYLVGGYSLIKWKEPTKCWTEANAIPKEYGPPFFTSINWQEKRLPTWLWWMASKWTYETSVWLNSC